MSTNAKDIMTFADKAKVLESRISETHNFNQLQEIAKEAAKSYQILSAHLMAFEKGNRHELTELTQRFSRIETEALLRFYGRTIPGRTVSIL